jgi:hypothetical protein
MSKIKGNVMIPVYAGKGKELEFLIYENGQVVDLTGLTGTLVVWLDIPGQDEDFVIEKALTIPTQTGENIGSCSCVLDNDDTDLTPAVYNYQLIFNYGTSDDRVLQSGTIHIIGDDTDRIEQIKEKYGFKFDYQTLNTAFNFAHSQMLNIGYEYIDRVLNTTDSNDCFTIDNYVMDKNFDGLVDEDDIVIFEYMNETPYTINDLATHVTGVTFNHPNGLAIIQMDGSYPSSSGYKVRVQYYKGIETYSYLINDIHFLEELLMTYHLFDILPIYKLQHGISKRDLNGVKIEYDDEAIKLLKEDLRIKILNQISKIRNLDGRGFRISKDYGRDSTIFNYGIDNSATRYRDFRRGFL